VIPVILASLPAPAGAQAWVAELNGPKFSSKVQAIVFQSHQGCDPCVIDSNRWIRWGRWTVSFRPDQPIAQYSGSSVGIYPLNCTDAAAGRFSCAMTLVWDAQSNQKVCSVIIQNSNQARQELFTINCPQAIQHGTPIAQAKSDGDPLSH
jgi:hypothetical protein